MTEPQQWTARDEERLADLRKRRADVYNAKREEHPYYGDDDIDLLFRFAAQHSTAAPPSGLQEIVAAQANDEGLWFQAQTAPEAYLQRALRKLHHAIEATAPVSGDARERANVIYDAALVDGTRGRSKLMAEQDIASITPHIEQAIIYGIAAAITAADRARGMAEHFPSCARGGRGSG